MLNKLTEIVFKTLRIEFPTNYHEIIIDLNVGESLKSLELGIAMEPERLQKKFGVRYSGLYTN